MKEACTTLLSISLLVGLVAASEPAATHELREAVEVGTQTHIKMHLRVRGQIRAGKEEMTVAGQALLEYPERTLEVGPDKLASKVVRAYVDGRAKFVVGKDEDPRQLRSGARLLVGEQEKQGIVLWAPGGPLTGDERELVEDVLDTTRLPGLLPKDAVKIGDSWEPAPDVIKALCDFEHFISSDLKCTLASADKQSATVKIAGAAQGLAVGAEIQSKIESTLTFDVGASIISKLEWQQTDTRGPGPVSPMGAYEAKITIDRQKATSPYLSDTALKGVTLMANPASKLILFEDQNNDYRFYHDRQWHTTAIRPDLAVLRRMEGSSFTAQLNIARLQGRQSGTRMSPEEFQEMISQTGGWNIEQIVRSVELPTDGSFHLQLLSATGRNGELALVQRHYLATSPTGKQLVFSFITEPQTEEKLGTTDLSLVGTIEFPEHTAAQDPASSKK